MKAFSIEIKAIVDSNGALSFELYGPKDLTKKGMIDILLASALNQGATRKDFGRVRGAVQLHRQGLPKMGDTWATRTND